MRTAFFVMLLTLFLLAGTLQAQPGSKSKRNNDDAAQQDRSQRGDKARKSQSGDMAKKRQRGQRQRAQRQFDPQKMFQRFDQNQDGVITADEVPERIRERMVQRADANSDGTIDKNEFMTHIKKAMQQRGKGAQGRMQRGNMKGQGNAKGRKGQRSDQPRLSFRNPENLDANQVMETLDRSGDGALQKSELPKMMSSKMDKIDADGDEVVDLSELRSAIEKMKSKAMDAGKGRYSTDSNSSKGQVPKRPGSGN